jgi:hypothetical protein
VMARADGDPLAVKGFADVLGSAAVDDERYDSRALGRRAESVRRCDTDCAPSTLDAGRRIPAVSSAELTFDGRLIFRQKTSLPPTKASVPAISGRNTLSGTREAI